MDFKNAQELLTLCEEKDVYKRQPQLFPAQKSQQPE